MKSSNERAPRMEADGMWIASADPIEHYRRPASGWRGFAWIVGVMVIVTLALAVR